VSVRVARALALARPAMSRRAWHETSSKPLASVSAMAAPGRYANARLAIPTDTWSRWSDRNGAGKTTLLNLGGRPHGTERWHGHRCSGYTGRVAYRARRHRGSSPRMHRYTRTCPSPTCLAPDPEPETCASIRATPQLGLGELAIPLDRKAGKLFGRSASTARSYVWR